MRKKFVALFFAVLDSTPPEINPPTRTIAVSSSLTVLVVEIDGEEYLVFTDTSGITVTPKIKPLP